MSTLIEELEQAARRIHMARLDCICRACNANRSEHDALRARIARLREFEATFATNARWARKVVFYRLAGPLDPEPGT